MNERTKKPRRPHPTRCPICGGTEFAWGHLQGQGLSFKADDAPILSKFLGIGYRVRARVCKACENIQLFAG